jgi:small basic protein (TIGR04137 family)
MEVRWKPSRILCLFRRSGRADFTAPTRGDATAVSIDKSLRRAGRLLRTRNVLKRTERIEKLEFEDRWQEGQSPFGLPKVRVIKSTIGKKKKKKKEEEEGAEEGLETLETPEEE